MSEWKECKLGDAAVFQRGHDLPKTEMKKGTIPVAGSNGIIGYHNESTTKGPGLTIGRSGNIGTPKFYQDDFWAHNTVLYVKDFKGNDEKYIFYFLQTFDFEGFNAGSAVPTLNRNHIHEIPVVIPPLPEQRAIAGVLSSLDDKIDLLHRQNKTLEEMAEALWRQMFVEEADPGWKKGKLGDIVSVSTGKGLKRIEYNENGLYPVIGANGEIGRTDKYLTNEKLILTGRVGTLGEIFISNREVWISDNVLIIKPNEDRFFYAVYFLLKNMDFENLNVGSTQPLVTQTDFKNIEIELPGNDILDYFATWCESGFNKIEKNVSQIRTISRLRDTLLPKLMSGEVRVRT